MARILVKFKDVVRQEVPLVNPITSIGRNTSNDIHIDNLAVSRHHAQLVMEGEGFVIEDLNSNNGTTVNGQRIQRHTLKDGDQIQIGKHVLVYDTKEAAAPIPSPAMAAHGPSSDDLEGTFVMDPSALRRHQVTEPTPPAAPSAAPAAAVAPAPKPQPQGELKVLQGDVGATRFNLTSAATTIGKGDTAEVRLSGFFTPRLAAVINRRADGYHITPSGNFFVKPKLNGQSIPDQQKLDNGDIIEVGGFKFQFNMKS